MEGLTIYGWFYLRKISYCNLLSTEDSSWPVILLSGSLICFQNGRSPIYRRFLCNEDVAICYLLKIACGQLCWFLVDWYVFKMEGHPFIGVFYILTNEDVAICYLLCLWSALLVSCRLLSIQDEGSPIYLGDLNLQKLLELFLCQIFCLKKSLFMSFSTMSYICTPQYSFYDVKI